MEHIYKEKVIRKTTRCGFIRWHIDGTDYNLVFRTLQKARKYIDEMETKTNE